MDGLRYEFRAAKATASPKASESPPVRAIPAAMSGSHQTSSHNPVRLTKRRPLRFVLTLAVLLFGVCCVCAADHAAEEFSLPQAPVTSSATNDGYWLVNSWRSPQSFDDGNLLFCPEVRRADANSVLITSDMAELQASIIPGVPVCIVVHGSFKDCPEIHRDARRSWHWLQAGACGAAFQMIYFSWPSDRPLSVLASVDVAILGHRASRNGFYLARLIQALPAECPVCLLGHSHGTRVISAALHLLAGGTVEDHRYCSPERCVRRIRAVFLASAIDHDWLNPDQRFGRALLMVEGILNLRNSMDPALAIYPLRRIGSSRALGCTGFTSRDRKEMQSLSCRAQDLDVTEVIGASHQWPRYASCPSLAQRIRSYYCFCD